MTTFRRLALCAGLITVLAPPSFADPSKHGEDLAAANARSLKHSSEADRIGALTVFTFEQGALYAVKAAPGRITDIALEPGERILSISAGDTARWIVGDAHSGEGETQRAHVLVKPSAPSLTTNLILMTDRRAYHLELESLEGPAMAEVSWRYPAGLVQTIANPSPGLHPKANLSPTAINLDYRISGDRTQWRPIGVFDDGHQVFVEMPEAISKITAPPLFILGETGEELVNYRIEGRYYVVDRLFDRAELSLGTGWKKKTVRIERTKPIGDVHD